jgi:hypothetical protein
MQLRILTLFLNSARSSGVMLSLLPMTGITFTLGLSLRMSSMSISLKL